MKPAFASLDSMLPSLLAAYGPPGRETGVRAVLRRLLKGTGSFGQDDATGNLHVRRAGSGRRLLLTAHMDAPGIIVTRLEGDTGQARIAVLGGRKPAELVGASVLFEGDRAALIAWERKDGADPEPDQLILETGITKRGRPGSRGARGLNGAAGPLGVGDVAALEDRPIRIGDYWCAANLDNRAGCAVLVQALTRARRVGYDVHAVFTAQSDLGARGATTSAFGIEPDLAVVIDVAHVGEPKETSGFTPGKGPCVALKEHGFLAHPEMLEVVRKAARAARVPLQYLIREGDGSDARAVRASRMGVPTAVLAIPARRSGGVWSLVHARDLEQTVALIGAVLAGGGGMSAWGAARGKAKARPKAKTKAKAKARPRTRGGRR